MILKAAMTWVSWMTLALIVEPFIGKLRKYHGLHQMLHRMGFAATMAKSLSVYSIIRRSPFIDC
jgi:hypothetical protein